MEMLTKEGVPGLHRDKWINRRHTGLNSNTRTRKISVFRVVT